MPSAKHTSNRREFLKAAAGSGALAAGLSQPARAAQVSALGGSKPNFLFIICDQLGLDAIAAHSCPDVHTPNIDRLVRRGATFSESHSTNPVCSPARSSMFTGRMPVETGVISNNRAIHPSCPNMGQWLDQAGYESYYCGKWHLPHGYPTDIVGFNVLPVGQGQGDLVDTVVSRWSESFLKSRNSRKPFCFVASLMQPHDICYWAIQGPRLVPEKLPFDLLAGKLPELPPNNKSRPKAPAKLDRMAYQGFSDDQWRYYLYIYYRQVEMVDAEIGRILDALEDSGRADNTIVMLTSDHGDGRGRHSHVQKWYPYDESVKVPMIVSCPGKIAEGLADGEHLVSGLDVMCTMSDYAGLDAPPHSQGRSLRPLLERKPTGWREFVSSEHHIEGRMLRTERYKYVRYSGDPVEQLFDIKADPWEMTNLYDDAKLADVVRDHRKMLDAWEASLKPVEPMPDISKRPRKT
ncbi:MAG: sulfatase-like hydrolase/transferase [Planctomycetaceae bacterium]|nr:sulfatase-like hydrolase/transferase [Planctomycetaceae bacterium]